MSSVLMTLSSKMRLSFLLLCVICIIVEVKGHAGDDDSKEVESTKSPRHTSTSNSVTKASTLREVKGSTSNPGGYNSTTTRITNPPTPDSGNGTRTPQPGTRIITVLMNATADSITQDASNANGTAMYLAIGILAGVSLIAIVAAILLRCRSTRSPNGAQVKGQRAVTTPNPIYRQDLPGSQSANQAPYLIPRIGLPRSLGEYNDISAGSTSTESKSQGWSARRHSGSRRPAEPNYLDLLPD